MEDSSSPLSSLRLISSSPNLRTSKQTSQAAPNESLQTTLDNARFNNDILCRAKTYKPRMTPDQKLDRVFDVLRLELRWSLTDLVQALCASTSSKNIRRRSAFENAAYNTPEVLEYFLRSSSAKPTTRSAVLEAIEWGRPELRKELTQLGETSMFGKYDADMHLEDFDKHTLLSSMRCEAPAMLQTLQYICEPRFESDRELEDEYQRWTMIMAIMCYSQRRTYCSNIPTTLGLHFYTKGVKSREIDLLAKFGISVSYKSVL
jgi:hypothetical protein